MQRPGPIAISIGFILLLTVAVVCMYRVTWLLGPGGDGPVGEQVSASGKEFKVVQRHNGNMAEPYTVNLLHRVQGGEWKSEYLDHESTRWSDAEIIWDESTHVVKVYRDGDDLVKEVVLGEGASETSRTDKGAK